MAGLDEQGNPVCQPLDTLEDIINWNVDHLGFHESLRGLDDITVRESKDRHKVERRPEVLVCHDMKGGYLEDRFLQGCDNPEAYRFYHWHLIDTFVYFSHRFITIPPAGWVRAAHKNGVQILGTLITEWEDGSKLCQELLRTKETIDLVATKLADIAFVFGFDGWLINIENEIEEKSIPDLQYFVERVTHHCHNQLKDTAKVLWYDSITHSGSLDWQNELNDKNKLFFSVCDGIFLNYAITEEKLASSKQMAETTNRCFDVYVGVDVFGRATPGGGGFNCSQVLKLISKVGLSCAIFAQGWVYENHEADKFDNNELKFWKLLKDLLPRRTHTLPLRTSFCQGFGEKHYLNGKVVSEKSWHNLSLQQLQPCYGDSDWASLVTCDAYNGGGCLKLTNPTTGEAACIKLFMLSLDKRGQPLTVTATWKNLSSQSSCCLSFALMAHDNEISQPPSGKAIILTEERECYSNIGVYVETWNKFLNRGAKGCLKQEPFFQFANKEKNESDWNSSQWDVNTDCLFNNQIDNPDHHQCVVLYALLVSTSDSALDKSVLLGNLQVQWKQSPQACATQRPVMIHKMTCLEVNAGEVLDKKRSLTVLHEIEVLKRATPDQSKEVVDNTSALGISEGTAPVMSKQCCLFKKCVIDSGILEGAEKPSTSLHILNWVANKDSEADYYMVFLVDENGSKHFIGCTCTNSFVTRLDSVKNPCNVVGYFVQSVSSIESLQGQNFNFSII